MGETELRKEILERVRRLAALRTPQPFVPGKTRIPYAGRVYDGEEMAALVDSSLDFWLTAGRYANEFEESFAKSFGTKYCMLTNSGSSANLLALSALTGNLLGDKKLKAGDRVITCATGFPTTVNPIFQNGMTPIFVDVELGKFKGTPTPKCELVYDVWPRENELKAKTIYGIVILLLVIFVIVVKG